MSPSTLEKKPKLQPLISRLSVEDAHAAATVQVNAMVSHTVQLRIQPLDTRPPLPVQVKIKTQAFRDTLAAGKSHTIKAVVEQEVVGVAMWQLIENKRALVEDGFAPPPPRERTKEDEEALEGVDVEIRQQIGMTSATLRNETMRDSKYWCVGLVSL
jgi:hypothetical protein